MTRVDSFLYPKQELAINIQLLVDQISNAQQDDGAIPWWRGYKTDPWDHVEAVMGLSMGGAFDQSLHGFEWLRASQLEDGSWYSAYYQDQPVDLTRESHHAAYVATGLGHYYLITGDREFIRYMWPTIDRAFNFVLSLRGREGEIYWALDPRGRVDKMALLTGCSSIAFSLKCALHLADIMGVRRPQWAEALVQLKSCMIRKPHRFNMTKARFAMDWYYPVLCGVIQGSEAQRRISGHWKKFVIDNMGVRCVSDHPWVTIAESSELILTLTAMGRHDIARMLFGWISERTFEDHTFHCGFTVPDMTVWPAEKITWTNAAALLAIDALYGVTPAADLFRHD